MRDLRELKDDAKVVGMDGKVTKETRVAEGEGVTTVLYACSLPVQLTATHGEHVTMPARTASPSMASQPMLII